MVKRRILLIIVVTIIIGLIDNKIVDFCINSEDNCYRGSRKKKARQTEEEEVHDFDYWNNQNKERTPITFFDCIKSLFRMRAGNNEINKYIEGFKHIVQTFSDLYYKKKNSNFDQYFDLVKDKISYEDLPDPDEKPRDLLREEQEAKEKERLENNEKRNTLRNLETTVFRNLDRANNTDLFNEMNCDKLPNLKAYHTIYTCNGQIVTKEQYEQLIINPENVCDFNKNIVKICICPVNYVNCLNVNPRLFCELNKLIVNKVDDLLKYKNTFYYEYMNNIVLDIKNNPFNYDLGLRCAYVEKKYPAGNFYLSIGFDEDFEVISTHYPDDYPEDQKKQYSTIEVKNPETPILNYFVKLDLLVIYDKCPLSLTLSIFDMLWVLPRKVTSRYLTDEESAALITGKKSFEFVIDIVEMLNAPDTDEIFLNDIYPKQKKGNLIFYELIVYGVSGFNFQFFSFRGEVIIE